MKFKVYVVAALTLVAGVTGAQGQVTIYAPATPSEKIVFDDKSFHESRGGDDEAVYVAGTLSGDGVPYPNNSVSLTCEKKRGECFVIRVEQIGPNQIGRITAPDVYSIARWNQSEIVVSDYVDYSHCRRLIISIERKTQTVIWVEQTNPQADPVDCRKAETRRVKWSIEDWRP